MTSRLAAPFGALPLPSVCAERAAAPTSTVALLTLAALATISLLPLLLVSTLPFFDYPNHLSRAHVLANLAASRVFSDWFDPASFLIPNVSADVLLVLLSPLLGTEAAGKALVAAICLLTLGGAAALGRAATGRLHPWPLFAALLLFNEMLFWGFLNYALGLALLLWGLAAWIALAERSRELQLVAGAAFALGIFFSHLVAFGLFAAAVAVWETANAARRWLGDPDPHSWRPALLRLLVSAAIFVPPTALYFALSPLRGLPGAPLFNFTLFEKVTPFTRLLSSGNAFADAALLLAPAGLIAFLVWKGRVALHPRLGLVAAALWFLQLILPYSALHSFFVDARVALAVVLVLLASLETADPDGRPKGKSEAGAAGGTDRLGWAALGVLVALRTASLSAQWMEADREYQKILAALDRIPRGSVVVSATAAHFEYGTGWFWTREKNPPHEHTASYATVRREAVVPAIFAKPGQNPLVLTPRSRSLGAIALGPIPRLTFDREFWRLGRRAAAIRAELDKAGRSDQAIYVAAFHVPCEELRPNLPLRAVSCGPVLSLFAVERRGPTRPIWVHED